MSLLQTTPARTTIDPRGPRFTAAVTSVVLAVVLLTAPSGFATAALGVQAALFAVGAGLGVQHTPLAWVFRTAIRQRWFLRRSRSDRLEGLAPPAEREDAAPPRFAQAVGLGFALVGLLGFLAGADLVGLIATGLALVAALLNAVFGLCLGCELYLLVRRVSPGTTGERSVTVPTTN